MPKEADLEESDPPIEPNRDSFDLPIDDTEQRRLLRTTGENDGAGGDSQPQQIRTPSGRRRTTCAVLGLIFMALLLAAYFFPNIWRPLLLNAEAATVENPSWPLVRSVAETTSSTTPAAAGAPCDPFAALANASALTASSQYDDNDCALHSLWDESGWAAAENDTRPWLQWDFSPPEALRPTLATVTEVQTAGRIYGQWIKEYALEYTYDNIHWATIQQTFTANADKDAISANTLNPPVAASKLRMHILDWHGAAATRVELIGCKQEVAADVRSEQNTTATIDMSIAQSAA